jgi:prepilin-type N-terminal cleavage/methylation domain-containing protein
MQRAGTQPSFRESVGRTAAKEAQLDQMTDRTARGFTLIELMTVVTIVGVLALIAVVSYRRVTASARMNEATGMIHSIRAAQERYHAETQTYADVSTNLASTYPAAAPSNFRTGWGGACTNCKTGMNWTMLSIRADGAVLFGYSTIAGQAGSTPPSFTVYGATISFGASASDWYLVGATGDWDANGIACKLYGTSYDNQLFVEYEGE